VANAQVRETGLEAGLRLVRLKFWATPAWTSNGESRLHRHIALLCAAVLSAYLAGCAAKRFEAKPQSASELTVALAIHYSGLIDRPFVATSTPPDLAGEYRSVARYWCAPNASSSTVGAAKVEYEALCSRLGGAFRGDFCVKPTDYDHVLFLAQIFEAPRSCANGTQVRVVEPTGDANAPMYVAKLRQLGFRTQAELAGDRANAAMLAKERARQRVLDADRRAAMVPRLRQRGTRVCHVEGTQTTVGYVEDSTETKLQIRMIGTYLTQHPAVQIGGSQPQIFWDFPARWDLCE